MVCLLITEEGKYYTNAACGSVDKISTLCAQTKKKKKKSLSMYTL